jgi:hypothetical protein
MRKEFCYSLLVSRSEIWISCSSSFAYIGFISQCCASLNFDTPGCCEQGSEPFFVPYKVGSLWTTCFTVQFSGRPLLNASLCTLYGGIGNFQFYLLNYFIVFIQNIMKQEDTYWLCFRISY